MHLDVLGFLLFGDEEVREDDCQGEENDNDNESLAEPSFTASHPRDAAELLLLGAMVVRHTAEK